MTLNCSFVNSYGFSKIKGLAGLVGGTIGYLSNRGRIVHGFGSCHIFNDPGYSHANLDSEEPMSSGSAVSTDHRSQDSQRQLEGGIDTTIAALLPDDSAIHCENKEGTVGNGSRSGGGSTEVGHSNGRTESRPRGTVTMHEERIPPNEHIAPRYRVPDSGVIRFRLDSNIPVQTYIVRPGGLESYRDGSRTFKYYGGFPEARMNQRQTLTLPFEGPWHLLIINKDGTRSASVNYSVYYD